LKRINVSINGISGHRNERRKLSEEEVGLVGNVGLVTRAKLKDTEGTADIKALMSKVM
jgi:hypothetical protein